MQVGEAGAFGAERATGGILSAVTGAVSGVAPHLRHHIAPIIGAAILTGATGTLVFGVLGLALMVPTLLRLRTRFGTWAAPAIALCLFVLMFGISTLLIGPLVRGASAVSAARESIPSLHQMHHPTGD